MSVLVMAPPAFREFVRLLDQYGTHINDENCGDAVKALKHASPPYLSVESVDIGDSPNVDSTVRRRVVILRYMTRHSGDY
jgi:hypothetical protein